MTVIVSPAAIVASVAVVIHLTTVAIDAAVSIVTIVDVISMVSFVAIVVRVVTDALVDVVALSGLVNMVAGVMFNCRSDCSLIWSRRSLLMLRSSLLLSYSWSLSPLVLLLLRVWAGPPSSSFPYWRCCLDSCYCCYCHTGGYCWCGHACCHRLCHGNGRHFCCGHRRRYCRCCRYCCYGRCFVVAASAGVLALIAIAPLAAFV